MKKRSIILSVLFLVTVFTVNAQNSWGLKGSFIYNSNGKLINEVGNVIDSKGAGEAGFNAGIYGRLNLGPIYIRPELVYTQVSSQYSGEQASGSYKMTSMDLPVLVGIKIIGPLNLLAGPAFKFILNNEFEGVEGDLKNGVTVGLNVGASLEFGRIGIDVIYDRGFSENEANFIGSDTTDKFTLDSRQQQLRIGVSYRLSSGGRR